MRASRGNVSIGVISEILREALHSTRSFAFLWLVAYLGSQLSRDYQIQESIRLYVFDSSTGINPV